MPFVILVLGVAALYAYFHKPAPLALPAGLSQYGTDLASLFGVPSAIAPSLSTGVSYLYQVLSPLAAQDLANELATIGAAVVAMPVALGPQEWGGVLTWQGPQGTVTEHLANVTWLSLVPAPVLSPAVAAPAVAVSTGGSPYVPGATMRRPQWDPHGIDDSLRAGFGLPPSPRSGNGGCNT